MRRFGTTDGNLRDREFLESNATVYGSISEAERAYADSVAEVAASGDVDRLDLGHEAVLYKRGAAVTVLFRDSNVVGRTEYASGRGIWFEPDAIRFAKRLHANVVDASTGDA